MSMSEERWAHGLRERPPVWPRREDRPAAVSQRWLREPEPFEDRGIFEPYPGATVLQDLDTATDETSSLRILGRYTAARVLLLGTAGLITGPRLLMECRIAREHLALLPSHDWERRILERLCEACCGSPAEAILDAAIIAAETAARRGHAMGAFALYRAAYELGRDRGLWASSAPAAAGIGRVARDNEAHRSARVWHWRKRVLERRARRDEERDRQRAAQAASQET